MTYKDEHTKAEKEEQEIGLQVLKILGLTVLIIGYILVAFAEIGELNELLSSKDGNAKVKKDLFF